MAQTIKLKRSATSGAIPTTSQLELGEVAINTYDGKMYIKKNVGGTESIVEIGSGGGLTSSFTLYEYTATASQTTFSGSDSNSNTLAYDTGTPPKILVYLNGVLLDHTTDYTATDGTSVVLTSGAAASDLVQVAAYKSESSVALDIDLADNVKLKFGDDDDLQIYHDGSNSWISEGGTGSLIVAADNFYVRNAAGNESKIDAISNGAVNLYYDNSKKFETTNDGVTVTGDVEADEFIGDVRGAVLFKAQAGETLAKGEVVYISGISGNTTVVSKADADDASKMPAFGLVAAAASSGNPVDIYTNGILSDIDTSSYSEGDELFVSTTAGALTATPPTGESAALQKIGKVTRSNATSGSIFIVGAGRTNAVPNLDDGDIFIGNASNQAVTQSLTTAAQTAGALMDSEVTNLAQVKAFDSSDYATAAQGTTADSAMQDLVDDTTPQLGGNLDLNSNNITGTGNISNTGTITSTGNISGSNLNVTSTNWLGWGDYGERISGSNANSSLTFSTDATTALTLDSSQNATFAGTISSGAITASSGADQILTLDQYTAGWNYIGFETNGTRKFYVGNGAGTNFIIGSDDSGVVLNISNFGSVDLNSANITAAGTISSGNITTTGYLRGPSTFTIDPATHGDDTGTVVIAGNLQVDGTTTTINSTTLTVDDKNITLASGSTNAAAANGAGLTVDCGSDTDATFTYDGTNDEWDFNKNVKVSGSVGVTNIVTNKVVKFNGTILDDSNITDTGSLITLGTSTDVSGPLQFTSNVSFSSSEAGRIYKSSQHGLAFHGVAGTENDFAMFTPAGQLMVVNPTGTNNVALVPTAGGSVGIGTGTSTPARKLEVKAGSEGYVARFKGSTSAVDIFAGNTGSFTGGLITTPTNIPLGLSTNTGAGVLIIATNNNVGIGTTSPSAALHVDSSNDGPIFDSGGTGNTNHALLVRDSANNQLLRVNNNGNVGIGTTNPGYPLHIWSDTTIARFGGTDTNDTYLNIFKDNATSIIKVQASKSGSGATNVSINPDGGNVGIGTASPGVKLDIVTSTASTAGAARIQYSGANDYEILRLEAPTNNDSILSFKSGASPIYYWGMGVDFSDSGKFKIARDNVLTVNTAVTIDSSNNVGIGTTSPESILEVSESTSTSITNNTAVGLVITNSDTTSGTGAQLTFKHADSNSTAVVAKIAAINDSSTTEDNGILTFATRKIGVGMARHMTITSEGNVGIGETSPQAKLQVEALGIDTTTTSTTSTAQAVIDTFAAATFRSARYTIQVTNSTDNTYHITEILLIHDGTTPQITEYGTIFTGSAEATFDADISGANVRLIATPATTDSMTFKVVRHCITV